MEKSQNGAEKAADAVYDILNSMNNDMRECKSVLDTLCIATETANKALVRLAKKIDNMKIK